MSTQFATVRHKLLYLFGIAAIALGVAGCQPESITSGIAKKAEAPVSPALVKKMKAKDMSLNSPIMIRIYKDESLLEVWKENKKGKFAKLTEYEICKWSGKLGPKIKEGDRQAPEGFYEVYARQMNPNSSYHLSFNIGFPNQFDRSYGRTGANLMVHGACSSAGCYSMTDDYVQDIYAMARDAFRGGQKNFQVQAYPFRMTAANMAKHAGNPNFEFWKMLKEGYDYTELTKQPPKVNVCERRYIFNRNLKNGDDFKASGTCPETIMSRSLLTSYNTQLEKEEKAFDRALAWSGNAKTFSHLSLANPPVPTVYPQPAAPAETKKPPATENAAMAKAAPAPAVKGEGEAALPKPEPETAKAPAAAKEPASAASKETATKAAEPLLVSGEEIPDSISAGGTSPAPGS